MKKRTSIVAALAVLTLAAAGLSVAASADEGPPVVPGTRSVLFVGNNWDGTADVIDPQSFAKLGRLSTVPDLQERLREIYTNPERLGYFVAIRQLIGEGHDQFADDIFSSHDGRFAYVSRPSLADVVSIEVATNRIAWRFEMEGQRADHMAISPDGTRLLVSDSTARKAHALDTATGKKVGEFESGDSPHESNYSKDGSKIFHASIGMVYTPGDDPVADSTKGDRFFQIVDAKSYAVVKRLDIGKILAENGYPGLSSAVRPMAISPDEKTAFFQLSFLHGFVEFDLTTDKPVRVVTLPQSEEARNTRKEDYLLDSAHHGLAISPDGKKLCAAGTMSDYAAIVDRETSAFKTFDVGKKPYWSTNSADGKYCFVSASGDDLVTVLDYASEKEVARIGVGDHPQRMRMGIIRTDDAGSLAPAAPAAPAKGRQPANLRVLRAAVKGRALELRLQMSARAAGGAVKVAYGSKAFSATVPGAETKRPTRSGNRPLVTWTVRVPLSARQRRARTRMVHLTFAGSDRLFSEDARVRAGRRASNLTRTASALDAQGRLSASGTVARRARGVVKVQLAYEDRGDVLFLKYDAPISGGRWRVERLLPSKAAREGGHLSLRYAGDKGRSIRGEQTAVALRP